MSKSKIKNPNQAQNPKSKKILKFGFGILFVIWTLSFGIFSPVFADDPIDPLCTNVKCGEKELNQFVICGRSCDDPNTDWNETCSCTIWHIFKMMKNIMDWLMLYGGIFAALFIAGGGIMMLISRGNPGQISKAKMWITNAVIGLLFIFIAWLIINTIFIVLGFPGAEFTWPPEGIKWGP